MRPGEDSAAPTVTRVGTAAELADLIRARGPAVVLTGAGMSTESGIPDFRSATGLWAEVDPFEVASIDAFRRDPLRVWRWYGPRIDGLLAARPNAGHEALAALERAGPSGPSSPRTSTRCTQRAGSASVVELHGSIASFTCLACGAREPLDAVLAQLRDREAPLCPACGDDPQAGCRDVRRAPAGRRVRARRAARAGGGRHGRRRLVAPGLAGRRPPAPRRSRPGSAGRPQRGRDAVRRGRRPGRARSAPARCSRRSNGACASFPEDGETRHHDVRCGVAIPLLIVAIRARGAAAAARTHRRPLPVELLPRRGRRTPPPATPPRRRRRRRPSSLRAGTQRTRQARTASRPCSAGRRGVPVARQAGVRAVRPPQRQRRADDVPRAPDAARRRLHGLPGTTSSSPLRPNGITRLDPRVRRPALRRRRTGSSSTSPTASCHALPGGQAVVRHDDRDRPPSTPRPRRAATTSTSGCCRPTRSGPFGPGGIGISAFSPVLTGWAQGGPIAIHGTNQPASIGLRRLERVPPRSRTTSSSG